MCRALFAVAVVCVLGLASAQHAVPAYFYPVEHRNAVAPVAEILKTNAYDYSIIPSDEYADYALTEYDPTAEISIWDFIPNPITVVKTVLYKALSLVKCLLRKAVWIGVGIALAVGFCAFTPFCTLTLERPFTRELRSLTDRYPYLDYAENFLVDAYTKFRDMQNA